MKYNDILLVGGSGFIGRSIAAQLVKAGKRVTVLTRRRDRARELFLLPTMDVLEGDPSDAATLDRVMAGSDAVINVVGILHGQPGSPFGPDFQHAHVDLVGKIVESAQRTGVRRILQMSAIGAALDAPSMYLRSKAAGEDRVRGSGLDWTLFRPSVVFGEDDRFLNLFATLQRWLPVMPLACAHARFEPVFVGDVARAFVCALDEDAAIEGTYELVGPRAYALIDLVRFAGAASGHPRPVIALPAALGALQARVMEWLPGPTLMSRDNIASMQVDSVASGRYAGLEADELGGGVDTFATPMESIASLYLRGEHQKAHFDAFRVTAHR